MMTHKPDRRLMKDTLFCFGGYVTVLKAGEICEYFAHSDTLLPGGPPTNRTWSSTYDSAVDRTGAWPRCAAGACSISLAALRFSEHHLEPVRVRFDERRRVVWHNPEAAHVAHREEEGDAE